MHTPALYFSGFSDCVRCHFCGLGLRNGEYGDGAWEEHARWSADCWFLKQNKSEEFITSCQQKRDESSSCHEETKVGYNGVARTLKKLRTSKGDYCIKQ